MRRRDRTGQRMSILTRLRALGVRVKRRSFPVRNGSGTDDRKVIARVKGVESAPITNPEHYGDAVALDRAYTRMTRTSDAADDAGSNPPRREAS